VAVVVGVVGVCEGGFVGEEVFFVGDRVGGGSFELGVLGREGFGGFVGGGRAEIEGEFSIDAVEGEALGYGVEDKSTGGGGLLRACVAMFGGGGGATDG